MEEFKAELTANLSVLEDKKADIKARLDALSYVEQVLKDTASMIDSSHVDAVCSALLKAADTTSSPSKILLATCACIAAVARRLGSAVASSTIPFLEALQKMYVLNLAVFKEPVRECLAALFESGCFRQTALNKVMDLAKQATIMKKSFFALECVALLADQYDVRKIHLMEKEIKIVVGLCVAVKSDPAAQGSDWLEKAVKALNIVAPDYKEDAVRPSTSISDMLSSIRGSGPSAPSSTSVPSFLSTLSPPPPSVPRSLSSVLDGTSSILSKKLSATAHSPLGSPFDLPVASTTPSVLSTASSWHGTSPTVAPLDPTVAQPPAALFSVEPSKPQEPVATAHVTFLSLPPIDIEGASFVPSVSSSAFVTPKATPHSVGSSGISPTELASSLRVSLENMEQKSPVNVATPTQPDIVSTPTCPTAPFTIAPPPHANVVETKEPFVEIKTESKKTTPQPSPPLPPAIPPSETEIDQQEASDELEMSGIVSDTMQVSGDEKSASRSITPSELQALKSEQSFAHKSPVLSFSVVPLLDVDSAASTLIDGLQSLTTQDDQFLVASPPRSPASIPADVTMASELNLTLHESDTLLENRSQTPTGESLALSDLSPRHATATVQRSLPPSPLRSGQLKTSPPTTPPRLSADRPPLSSTSTLGPRRTSFPELTPTTVAQSGIGNLFPPIPPRSGGSGAAASARLESSLELSQSPLIGFGSPVAGSSSSVRRTSFISKSRSTDNFQGSLSGIGPTTSGSIEEAMVKLKHENARLVEQLRRSEAERTQLAEQVATHQAESDVRQSQMTDLTEENEQLRSACEKLQQHNDGLAKFKASALQDIENLTRFAEEQREEVQRLATQIEEQKAINLTFQSHAKAMLEASNSQAKSFAKELEKAKAIIKQLEDDLATVQEDRDNALAERDRTAAELTDVTQQLETAKQQIEEVTASVAAEFEQQIADMKLDLDTTRALLAESEQQLQLARDRAKMEERMYKETQAKLAKAEELASKLEEQNQDLESKNLQLKGQVWDQSQAVDTLKAEVQTWKLKAHDSSGGRLAIAEAERKAEQAERKSKEAQALVASLEQKAEALESELTATQDTLTSLREQFAELERVADDALQQLEIMQQQQK